MNQRKKQLEEIALIESTGSWDEVICCAKRQRRKEMLTEQQQKDAWKIFEHYGIDKQSPKTVEELLELATALISDSGTEEEVIDEIADVSILVAQLCMAIGVDKINARIEYKLARQLNRIYEEKLSQPPKDVPVDSNYSGYKLGEKQRENLQKAIGLLSHLQTNQECFNDLVEAVKIIEGITKSYDHYKENKYE